MTATPKLSEADHGRLLTTWLKRRGLLFIHVPNEGIRSVMAASDAIRQGLHPGAPDYLIFTPTSKFCGTAIELKRVGWKPRNRADKARFEQQLEFLAALEGLGWATLLCYGWEDTVKFLEELGY